VSNSDDLDLPLPIVAVSGDEAMARHTVNGNPDPTTPFGAALVWWQGVDDPVMYRHALEVMSYNPAAWGDYTEAAEILNGLSIMTGVVFNEDRDDIAYIKFIDFGGDEAGQVFEEAPIHDFKAVTLVKLPSDGWWRVWGLSDSYLPSAAEVVGE